MSDTTKLILAVVVVVVVVAVIIGLFLNARKRRELEHRRFEAGELRARIEEHAPRLQETRGPGVGDRRDRGRRTREADRTAAEAERKAAEARELEEQAQQKAAEARRLEEHAEKHAEEAAQAQSSLVELEREADRVDPDVRTDDEGYRLDESGQRLPDREPEAAAPAGAVAAPSGACCRGVGALPARRRRARPGRRREPLRDAPRPTPLTRRRIRRRTTRAGGYDV